MLNGRTSGTKESIRYSPGRHGRGVEGADKILIRRLPHRTDPHCSKWSSETTRRTSFVSILHVRFTEADLIFSLQIVNSLYLL
jgi:hypothetical protein